MRYIKGHFITTEELAKRWGVSEGTLRNKRAAGEGPAYEKVGMSVLYDINVVRLYEEAHGFPEKEFVNESE